MKVVMPRTSLEYVSFPILSSPVHPSAITHEVAITPNGEQPTTWEPATYTNQRVRILVRASTEASAGGAVTLSVGLWEVWWRGISAPEIPVRRVGLLQVL